MPLAIRFTEYGGPDVLTVDEVPLPEPGNGQVRVRVRASGVSPYDWKTRQGLYSGGKPLAKPRRTGSDFAGVLDAVGGRVDGFTGGERVVGQASGTAAEYVIADVGSIAVLPDSIDDVTGAAIPNNGRTAIRTLRMSGVQSGQTLLVHAASGGVGSFLTQLAVEQGIMVIGTASERNLGYLESIGAVAVSYGDGWVDRVRAFAPDGVDAVVDAAGTGVIEGSLSLVRDDGPVITIADFTATGPNVIVSDGSEPGFEHSLTEAVAAVARGAVVIPIERTFPLAEIAEAHRLSETRHVRGKIVVTVD